MAQGNWQQVREIFVDVVSQKPDDRNEYLKKACKNEPDIKFEVESLLASYDDANSFMETPAFVDAGKEEDQARRTLVTGQKLGHYKILEQLGSGGMGEVFLAQDTRLDRKVAVKVLYEKISSDESNLQRFIQEAKAASGLNHPNILVIHEIGESVGAHYIVSEHIEGKTLRDFLRTSDTTLSEVLDFSVQIASALAAAHSANLVHRDIKPENIMVRPDRIVKILDFGLAKLIEQKNRSQVGLDDETIRQNQTAKGVVLGTVNYMSPEQAKAKEVDARTDIFSFGVVLYEMVAGKTPFAGDSVMETLANLINSKPPPLSRFAKNVPDELDRIVAKALSKKREERYQSTKNLLTDLKDLRENLMFDERLERSDPPDIRERTKFLHPVTGEINIRTVETQNSFSQKIGRHKLATLAVSTMIIAALAVGSYFAFFAPHPPITSVAVLPFVNGSNDANLDYLADGLSENVIDRLSQLQQLKVIASSSSFKYRGENIDLKEVANKLDVQAIVTGVVTQRGDNLIVRVELVDPRENTRLWGEQFNRKATDALAVQQEIAQTIAGKLNLKLSGAQHERLSKYGTDNLHAYELLLQGDSVWVKGTSAKGGAHNRSELYEKVMEYYRQAIALDPNYALAYARISQIYRGYAGNSILDPKDTLPKALAAAQKAVELDSNLPEAHFELASLASQRWDWQTSEREYQRTLELNPNWTRALHGYSQHLSIMGRHEQAIATSYRAREVDPQRLSSYASVAVTFANARRFDEAIVEIKKIREVDPNLLLNILGKSYVGKGMYREAIDVFLQRERLGNIPSYDKMYLGIAYVGAGQREKAQAILEEFEKSKEYISPGELPILYVALGERDKAFELLEKAYAAHDLQLQNLKIEFGFDPLHDDPRFKDLLRRVGLPQ